MPSLPRLTAAAGEVIADRAEIVMGVAGLLLCKYAQIASTRSRAGSRTRKPRWTMSHPSHSSSFSSRQVVRSEHGEWEVAVARHVNAPTFTFDVTAPAEHMTVTVNGYVIACHNMTRADLLEHVQRCQEALAEEPGDA